MARLNKNNFSKYVFLLLFFLSNLLLLKAQQLIKVKSIGKSDIYGNKGPDLARQEALVDAKLAALREAGIEENLSNYQSLFTGQSNKDFSQFFNSSTQSEMAGAIKTYSIISEKLRAEGNSIIKIELEIEAIVIKYSTKKDISFDSHINGIKAVYEVDQKLEFDLKLTQNCNLTIFNLIDEKQCAVLFPLVKNKKNNIEANTLVHFPIDFTKEDDFVLYTDKKSESNQLIFVFTKDDIKYIHFDKDGNTNQEDMFSWIYSIEPEKRHINIQSFFIVPSKK
jgi:hypothetical protein